MQGQLSTPSLAPITGHSLESAPMVFQHSSLINSPEMKKANPEWRAVGKTDLMTQQPSYNPTLEWGSSLMEILALSKDPFLGYLC